MKCLYIILTIIATSYNLHSQKIASSKKLNVVSVNKFDKAYKVIGIKDGDTFQILKDGASVTIRFTHIDCPEKAQPFGNKAKQFLSRLIYGKYIRIAPGFSYDRNKRLLAEVYLNDSVCINKEIVKNGFAWHFIRYSNSKEYARLEKEARNKKRGLWSHPKPIAPWDWRRGVRNN